MVLTFFIFFLHSPRRFMFHVLVCWFLAWLGGWLACQQDYTKTLWNYFHENLDGISVQEQTHYLLLRMEGWIQEFIDFFSLTFIKIASHFLNCSVNFPENNAKIFACGGKHSTQCHFSWTDPVDSSIIQQKETHNAIQPLSDVTGCNLSDGMQLPLEP